MTLFHPPLILSFDQCLVVSITEPFKFANFSFFFPLIRVAIAVVSRCSHSLVLLEELVDGPSLCVDALVRDAVLVEHAPLGVKGHFPRLHSRDCVPHSHGISV